MSRPIEKAVRIVSGQQALADALGVSIQAVNQWVKGRRPVPPARCRAIEEATGGQVTVYELRPDVFGRPDIYPNTESSQGRPAL